MHRRSKPVRECHDCGLNFGDHCGVYAVPREMWHGRRCPGYKNEQLLQEYYKQRARHPVDKRKEERRKAAQLRRNTPHFQCKMPLYPTRAATMSRAR